MSQVRTQQYPTAMDITAALPWFPDVGSAAKLMEWFYRIKYWQIDLNLTTGAGAWGKNGSYFWQARDQKVNGVSNPANPLPTNERDLVLDADPDSFAGSIIEDDFLGTSMFLRLLDRYKLTVVADVQTEWYPFMLFSATDPSAGGSLSNDSTGTGGTPRSSAVVMTVDGFNVPMYEPVDIAPNTWFGTVDVTPIEWWPYAPTLGGPDVFDTATGAQISPNVISFLP